MFPGGSYMFYEIERLLYPLQAAAGPLSVVLQPTSTHFEPPPPCFMSAGLPEKY